MKLPESLQKPISTAIRIIKYLAILYCLNAIAYFTAQILNVAVSFTGIDINETVRIYTLRILMWAIYALYLGKTIKKWGYMGGYEDLYKKDAFFRDIGVSYLIFLLISLFTLGIPVPDTTAWEIIYAGNTAFIFFTKDMFLSILLQGILNFAFIYFFYISGYGEFCKKHPDAVKRNEEK